MSGIFNLEPAVRVFACPNCGATMDTAQDHCPSCGKLIDHAAAETAATAMSVLNQAISDASSLKILFGTLLAAIPSGLLILVKLRISFRFLYAIGLDDTLSGLYWLAMLVALGMFAVLGLGARWWTRFASLDTADPEFPAYRRSVVFTTTCALVFILFMAGITFYLRSQM